MTNAERHIVVATDRRFTMPTATTLRSISLSDSGPITAWVLSTGLTAHDRRLMSSSVNTHSLRIEWVDMDHVEFGQTAHNPLGRASYFRLAMGEVLPGEIEKALYLDTDMLVLDSLAPLWHTETPEGRTAWAVRSVHFPSVCTYGAVDRYPELGLNPRAPYFNSGLIMVDLQRWRDEEIGLRALSYLASPLANGQLADQEALNVVLAEKWGELHPRWNLQSPFYEHNRGVHLLYSDEIIEQARANPAVIHFLNRPKPWQTNCVHPEREAWLTMAGQTAFAPIELVRPTLRSNLTWRAKRAASALIKGK